VSCALPEGPSPPGGRDAGIAPLPYPPFVVGPPLSVSEALSTGVPPGVVSCR